MLISAAGRRTRRNTAVQLTRLADSLHLPFLCPAQLRWNSTHSQQAAHIRASSRLQSQQPEKTQTRRLATVADQSPISSSESSQYPTFSLEGGHSSRWNFSPSEQFGLKPQDPLILQHSTRAPETSSRLRYGLGGTVSDLMQTLYTCLRVERFERARVVIQRIVFQSHPQSFEVQHAHKAFLEALLQRISPTNHKQGVLLFDAMSEWFEAEVVSKEVPIDAQMLTIMMRGAINGLGGAKQERAIRRYADLAEITDEQMMDELSLSDEFTDDEFMTLGSIIPNIKMQPTEEVAEVAQTSEPVPSPHVVNTVADLPEILSVAQKGMGLTSLKQTLDAAAPALGHATTLADVATANLSPVERQRILEESASQAAVARWKHDDLNLQKLGIHTTLEARPLGALMWKWYSDLLPALNQEIQECRDLLDKVAEGPGNLTNDDRLIYGPYLESVSVEQLAATTIIHIMSLLAGGKDNHTDKYGSDMRLGRLTTQLGKVMQDEANAEAAKKRAAEERKARLGRASAPKKPRISKNSHPSYDPESHSWPSDVRVKLGAMLISKLINVAKIPVTRLHPRSKEKVTQLQPAFMHKTLYQQGRKQGWLVASTELVQKLHREPVATLIAKRLPMVIEPQPWTGFNKGGYLNYPTSVIRFSGADTVPRDYAYAAIQRNDLDQVFNALNVLGKVPWQINNDVLRVQLEAWNTGEKIANFAPLNPQVDLPPEPTDKADTNARRAWLATLKDAENTKSGFHSQRCFQNFQLEIARAFSKEKLYFPHNIDFRGRAYPVPPYLNHMGADNARALLKFGEGKPLGVDGLRWLKIHLANVFGYDKASLSEREEFAMKHLDDIRDSVENPLNGRRWWLQSEDAWQTLAACFELTAALDSPEPTEYVSYLPVHQDGTCNGLQHYAALGGDEIGARQVNLEPGDRPSDVYTAVAESVKAEVERDNALGHPVAKILHGKITRKVVKQPVMTNVYGVTYYGARSQVKKQLEELLPDIGRNDVIDHLTLASYVAKKIFKSLGEMFKGAQAIQQWLGECADRISTAVTPEQIEALQKDVDNNQVALTSVKKTAKNGANESVRKATVSKQMFRSSVIWTTPLRLPVVQPYRSSKRRIVKTNLQNVALQEPTSVDPVSKRKQLQGFPPNFIHSLDATHMMLSAIKCNEHNITFASIHDSFWTHACDITNMSSVLRDAFVAMHTEDVVGRLRQEFMARYKDCMYLGAVDVKSAVGKKILAAQKVRQKEDRPLLKEEGKVAQPALVMELLNEVKRMRLLNSEDAEARQQGEEMVTAGSIFAAEKDAQDALTIPTEITDAKLGEIPDNYDIAKLEDEEAADLTNPVLNEEGEVEEDEKEAAASAVGAVDGDGEAIPTIEELKAKREPQAKKVQARKVYVWLPLRFPEVPEKGTFDVTRLKESQYFFH